MESAQGRPWSTHGVYGDLQAQFERDGLVIGITGGCARRPWIQDRFDRDIRNSVVAGRCGRSCKSTEQFLFLDEPTNHLDLESLICGRLPPRLSGQSRFH